jgi:hypothetical protein
MKRSQVYFGTMVGVLCIWLGLQLQREALSAEYPAVAIRVLDAFPLLAVAVFGIACCVRLGLDLATFNNYPQEISKLERDIAGARKDLLQRGFTE